ncbi:pirin family protein [Burkholderia multivorans]|uniref:pirin family protein n=1 Tax=Burkholderia multivorans TaxID=87883 RepID=UPI0021BE7C0C|nr:pirin family protein [Burkholderia multivorans]
MCIDPFLFCVYHNDAYPVGNDKLGPESSLSGRLLGNDFSAKDGWSMYHGETVPGFPAHPHRGFETVTIVRSGTVDHSDSLGSSARFGSGDVQWLTAGRGIVHSEMFPLLNKDGANPLELFQIWLNLPAHSKMANPYFKMLWAENIPKATVFDESYRPVEITYICGHYLCDHDLGARDSISPPPDSWASQPDSSVAIWIITLAPHARYKLSAAPAPDCRRALYFFKGANINLGGHAIRRHCAIEVVSHTMIELINGPETSELLMLQGKPIGEPLAKHGPFVMNTDAEIAEAISDHRSTQFGGWPWPTNAPVRHRASPRHTYIPDLGPAFPPTYQAPCLRE